MGLSAEDISDFPCDAVKSDKRAAQAKQQSPHQRTSLVSRSILTVAIVIIFSYSFAFAEWTYTWKIFGDGDRLRSAKAMVTSWPTTKQSVCRAADIGYQTVSCPRWNHHSGDLGIPLAVDYRVRYLWKRQHPPRCDQQPYWVKSTQDNVGFGALMRGHYAGPFVGAVRSDRVFMLEPDSFPYAGCANDTSWTCYFEPLTNCSYAKHVRPLLERDPNLSSQWTDWRNESHRVISTSGWTSPEFFPSERKFDDIFTTPSPPDELVAGVLLYLLRLNARTMEQINKRLRDIIPCDLDPQRTIALPIRASDKCIGQYRLESGFGGESSCPSFQTYMEMAELIRESDPLVDTILLSSEDARFVEARYNYSTPAGKHPWRYVIHSKDVMQGSGDRQKLNGQTMDDVFMSFYTTLQMQMRAKYFVLNCASNYHIILRVLVTHGGCGFTSRPVIICMNEQATRFKICSSFDQGGYDKCMSEKEQELGVDAARAALRRLSAKSASASTGVLSR